MTDNVAPFSGSYRLGDVHFLLKQLDLQPMQDIEAKERLIQSGARHYSEMLAAERQPSAEYMALFEDAVVVHARSMARDLWRLAMAIRRRRPQGVTLVSLARAGTPIGVLLRHVLREAWGLDAPHYSISIIRDRGIDQRALDYICVRHPADSLVFVDGWTGKGAIAAELSRALASYRTPARAQLSDELYVLCDLAGLAAASGSNDDYLIPSAILNSTVSGLVSRSVLNEQIGPGDFHGCVYHSELAVVDRSQWFIERILAVLRKLPDSERRAVAEPDRVQLQQRSESLIGDLMQRFAIQDRNYIKPGVGEATRSLLRRTPRCLLLRDAGAQEVRHLLLLAQSREVPVIIDPRLPVLAAVVIRKLSDV
jgi:hypothetical protein